MKIVVLAPVHRYDDIRVFRKEATTLAEAGNEVLLYARTPDDLPRTEHGVAVEPVVYRGRRERFALLPRLTRTALAQRADVYHVHNPDTLPIGFVLRALGRVVVYDTHEDFRREILLRQWLPVALRMPAAVVVSLAERLAGHVMSAVIVTQEQLRSRIPGAEVIGNPPLFDRAAATEAWEKRRSALGGDPEPIVVGYLGGISADRGLFEMLRMVADLDAIHPTRLILIGYPVNDDALERARQMPEWRLVDYRGELRQEEAFVALAEARAGLILFQRVASHEQIDPNKIYEYLALGMPFVASDFASWRRRLEPVDAGLFVDVDAADTPARISDFLRNPDELLAAGARGIEFIAARYSWQGNGAPALLALYDRVRRRGPAGEN